VSPTQRKVCVVASVGGHLTEVRLLRSAYEGYEHFYVVNEQIELPKDMEGRTYCIRHAERNWLVLANFLEAWHILRQERPRVILSTGAGTVVPFTIVGKLLGIRMLFVESFACVEAPSLTGKSVYGLADRFFYQWEQLRRFFPKGIYGGRLVG